jgi:hypothetical protein
MTRGYCPNCGAVSVTDRTHPITGTPPANKKGQHQMTEPNSAEDKAMAHNLFDTTRDQAFMRHLIAAAPQPAARNAVVPTEGGNPAPLTRTPQEQQSRQFMAHLFRRPDADNLPDYQ